MINNNYAATFLEEYKIIQSKIDKIGEFKFKVKGWSITLVVGLIASIYANKVGYNLFPVILAIPLLFQILEHEQDEYSTALGNRAMALEKIIDRLSFTRDETDRKKQSLDMNALNNIQGAPRIAVILRNNSRLSFLNMLRKKIPVKSNFFYYFQYLLIIISYIYFFL